MRDNLYVDMRGVGYEENQKLKVTVTVHRIVQAFHNEPQRVLKTTKKLVLTPQSRV